MQLPSLRQLQTYNDMLPKLPPQANDVPDSREPCVSFYDAVSRHHAGKLHLRQGLRRMAEGGAALEAGEAHAACLPPRWLQQARACRPGQNPALDELETLDASLLHLQAQALDAARHGRAAQALQDLAALPYVRLSRRFIALLSELHLRAADGGREAVGANLGVN